MTHYSFKICRWWQQISVTLVNFYHTVGLAPRMTLSFRIENCWLWDRGKVRGSASPYLFLLRLSWCRSRASALRGRRLISFCTIDVSCNCVNALYLCVLWSSVHVQYYQLNLYLHSSNYNEHLTYLTTLSKNVKQISNIACLETVENKPWKLTISSLEISLLSF